MNIIRYPNEILNQQSLEVTLDYLPDALKTVEEMTKLMRGRKAAGLAAVQVGILRRYCLLEVTTSTAPGPLPEPLLIINPTIVDYTDPIRDFEGCLSLPLFWAKIDRFNEITLQFLDKDFKECTASFQGLQARALQHEIDHFNGITLDQYISPMVHSMWQKKLTKKTA